MRWTFSWVWSPLRWRLFWIPEIPMYQFGPLCVWRWET